MLKPWMFDSVAHERLLVKMESIGIEGDLLNWIRSFLNGRTQGVSVDGVKSIYANVLLTTANCMEK